MYKSVVLLILAILLQAFPVFSQATQNFGRYISPLDLPLFLSATFGEPRENHFHSGIDIRTNERTGYAVKTVADGKLARIRVSPNGYGKAIYIEHTNGFTSVYGHLDHFVPELENLIQEEQYKKHSYTVDVNVSQRSINFKQGDIIAYSGNTGGSGGPHLHFEIRETKSEKPVNPLLYGYTITDLTRPITKGIYWYDLNNYYQNGATSVNYKQLNDSTWVTDTLFIPTNIRLGMGWKGYDQHDMVPNKNGIYSLQLFINNSPQYAWQMQSFSFDETRYSNCMVDYAYKIEGNGDIYQCFKLPGNRVSLLDNSPGEGGIQLVEGDTIISTIIASDINGNNTYVKSVLVGIAGKPNPVSHINAWPSRSFQYTTPSTKILIPGGAFYDSLFLLNNTYTSTDSGIFSDVLEMHNSLIPLHKPAEIYLLPQLRLSEKNASKAIIMHRSISGKESSLTTTRALAWYKATNRETGSYYLRLDTLSPEICLSNFDVNRNKFYNDILQAYITDDLSGISQYDAWLDGDWFPMEYDAKNDLLFWKMEKSAIGKKHSLKITVSDAVGNSKSLLVHFIY